MKATFFASIDMEATVIWIVCLAFLTLFVVAGVRDHKREKR